MFYIKTNRGWKPLHKLHYEIAKSWRERGLNVEEHVAGLDACDTWVSDRFYDYWDARDRLFYGARHRAKKYSIKFDITRLDFDIPKECPLRRVPLAVGKGQHTENSPTLDRKDPRLGYVKGNVWVISHKANRLKGDLTPNELKLLCENVLALDWVAWTSEDEQELQKVRLSWKQKMNESQKSRWWDIWGRQNAK
ncbi:hypothetical protein [Bradyrhizobium sp. USDA 4353]